MPSNTKSEMTSLRVLEVITALAVLCFAGPASAQTFDDSIWNGIEEMVVTGDGIGAALLVESGNNSVTAFDSETLQAMGVANVEDLASVTPNLEIVTSGATSPTLFIRGVGLNDFTATSGGAIAVYQDDVPMNSPAIQLGKIFDVGAAATVNGPQGSGPFRNASGGAISISSRAPTGDFGAYLRSDFGSFGLLDFEGALELPIVPDLISMRTAFAITKRGGYARNRCGGAPPRAERPVNTGSPTTRIPPSICGERVPRALGAEDGISPIAEGLPTRINDANNWAARTVILLTPDLPIDTEWKLTAFVSGRDEDSRVGQSIGSDRASLGDPDARGFRDLDIAAESAELLQSLRDAGVPSPGIVARAQLARNLVDLDRDPFAGSFNRVGQTTNDVAGGVLKGTMTLGEVDITTVTGAVGYDRRIDIDSDFSPNVSFEILTDDEGRQFTQEIRASGVLGDADSLIPFGDVRWEVGGLFLNEELDVFIAVDFGEGDAFGVGNRTFTQETTSANGYVEAEWDLTEFATFDAGFRFNYEKKKIDYRLDRAGQSVLVDDDVSWTAPTGRVRLTLRPTEDVSFYLMYNRGWKSGNYNARGSLQDPVSIADPENINAYEFGFSASLFGDILDLRGALFYYDYEDYQLFTADNNFGAAPEFVVLNASSAEVFGGELQVDLRPWEGGLASLRAGWLESQFLDFTQQQLIDATIGGERVLFSIDINNSGNRVLNTPRFDLSYSVEQEFDFSRFGSRLGVFTLRYDGSWTAEKFFDASKGRGTPDINGDFVLPRTTIGQRSVFLHNLRASWQPMDGPLAVSFWMRNITNEAVKKSAFDATAFQGTTVFFVGEPRMYGVSIRLDY